MIYLRLLSASQVGSDSDLRSLVTSMQSEITRLKALLDAKPPAATTSAEPNEQEGDEDDDEEDDDEEEAEEEGDDEYETPPPKGTKPADDSVTKGPKSNKGPNSTTHRAAWMKFGRRMDSQGSEFPEMSKMWNGSKEETWLLFGVLLCTLSNITRYVHVHPNRGTARSVCKMAGEGDEHGQHRGPADHY